MQHKMKVALVCGGSSGLGAGIADALAKNELRVICTTSRAVDEADKDLIQLDLELQSSIEACASKLIKESLPDVVVINGPGPVKGSTKDLTAQDWAYGFQVLWAGPLALLAKLLPAMAARGSGTVIWVTSIAADHYIPNMAISTSLRAGLHGLVRTLAAEYAGAGITVNALAPGFHATERLRQIDVSESILPQIPAARLGEPAEFGECAAFLASDGARYVTGQVLTSDGGWAIRAG